MVFIVEDEDTLRRILEYALGKMYRVASSGNGTEALKMIRDLVPDVVISGIKMPGLNGWELYEALRGSEDTATIRFVLFTLTHGLHAKAKQLGMDAYVPKPTSLDQLLDVLEDLLKDRYTSS